MNGRLHAMRARVDAWWSTAAALPHRWCRVLLAVLGCCQLLMAVGATPRVGAFGLVGGGALIAVALRKGGRRSITVALVVVGTVPFAALTVSALVPPLVGVLAFALATVVHGGRPSIARRTEIEVGAVNR